MHFPKLLQSRKRQLQDLVQAFLLSREAALLSPLTVKGYEVSLVRFIEWLRTLGVTTIEKVRVSHVHNFLVEEVSRGLADVTVRLLATRIKVFLRWCYAEGHISQRVNVTLPKVSEKRRSVLNGEQLSKVLRSLTKPRNLALVLMLADTGLRPSEAAALNWGDVDANRGTIQVQRGKGAKARIVVVGKRTRQALLTYLPTVPHNDDDPVFHNGKKGRLSYEGLRSVLRKVTRESGIKVTGQILRRTNATLSLKAGMNPRHLQALLGHSTLEITWKYVLLLDDDLLSAHHDHGPVDTFLN